MKKPTVQLVLSICIVVLVFAACLLMLESFWETDICLDAGGAIRGGICEGVGAEYVPLRGRSSFWIFSGGLSLLAGYGVFKVTDALFSPQK